jgi:hypothetical protein
MKTRPFAYFLLLFAGISLSSCEGFFDQVVEIDIPEHEPVLAVSAHFRSQDTVLTVFVSRSAGILDSLLLDTVKITGASIEIWRDGAAWQTLPHLGEGHYRLGLGEVLGADPSTYTLRVAASGYDPVEASQAMPAPVVIEEVEYEAEGGINPDGNKVNTISVTFQDPVGQDNYYLLDASVIYSDSLFGDFESTAYLSSEDVLVEEHNGGLIFRDGPIEGKRYTLKAYTFESPHILPGSKLVVRLRSISRDRYLFLRTLDLYGNAQGNPFAEPVVVHQNIEGGVGIFSVEAMDEEVISF